MILGGVFVQLVCNYNIYAVACCICTEFCCGIADVASVGYWLVSKLHPLLYRGQSSYPIPNVRKLDVEQNSLCFTFRVNLSLGIA